VFHARVVDEPTPRSVWLLEVDRPALVLGSAQPEADADATACAAAGVEIVRRRSGGGAVLLVPREVLWVDVIVPRGDPRWVDDVGHAFHWLGDAWADALAACGVAGAVVHRGAMVRTPWSALVCFSGRGPGEVVLGERKVIGMSQRRTRSWARFQCAVYRRWDPAALAALLAVAPPLDELADVAVAVPVPLDELAGAFLATLATR
jgi:lipoate-protein ligase A